MQNYLSGFGYEVTTCTHPVTGMQKIKTYLPDLIILDIMLPEMDGLEVCRRLRQKNIGIPVIMLTAKGGEIDKIVGLEIGADDYMTKPFSIRELLARIKARLRNAESSGKSVPEVYSIGDLEVDFARYKIKCKGKELDLTSLETEILKYFVAHRGEVIARNDLLDKVWGYESYPTTRTVDNHILKLRKKMEEDPSHPRYILSVYGGGYRFIG
jgi:two-component system alkaline phosphatase synthesis response regulator PhoP